MNANQYVDIFATKGIEYLLVIGFLLTLVIFWRRLNRPTEPPGHASAPVPAESLPWFRIADGVFFHQGHSWAAPAGDDALRVGIDDFAQKLIGPVDALEAPPVGTTIDQGEVGWRLRIGSKSVPLLSPVNGTVMAVNEEVAACPHLINQDPYGKGWLLLIRVSKQRSALSNLLTGRLAAFWMDEAIEALRRRMQRNLGPLLQDGGLPVSGFARELSPEHWEQIAAEFFRTK